MIAVDSVLWYLKVHQVQERRLKIYLRNLQGKRVQEQFWQIICCSSIGFPLLKCQSLSERVCRGCGRKIRNAAEFYYFIKTAVTSSNATAFPAANCESTVEKISTKRQLPTTVTPERKQGKKAYNRTR